MGSRAFGDQKANQKPIVHHYVKQYLHIFNLSELTVACKQNWHERIHLQ